MEVEILVEIVTVVEVGVRLFVVVVVVVTAWRDVPLDSPILTATLPAFVVLEDSLESGVLLGVGDVAAPGDVMLVLTRPTGSRRRRRGDSTSPSARLERDLRFSVLLASFPVLLLMDFALCV